MMTAALALLHHYSYTLGKKGRITHMHAMLMIKMRANFELRLMFRSLIRRTGSKAMLKSQIAKMADIRYVNATMVFMLIQVHRVALESSQQAIDQAHDNAGVQDDVGNKSKGLLGDRHVAEQ
jgi:hypothetical protein